MVSDTYHTLGRIAVRLPLVVLTCDVVRKKLPINMHWYRDASIWLLIVAFIVFMIAVIGYEMSRVRPGATWFWAAFVLALVLVFAAILTALGMHLHSHRHSLSCNEE